MVDVSAIAGTVSALKGAMDITKAMIGLRDGQAMQAKVIELNSIILDAQHSAFAANEERSALIERIRELEKQLGGMEAWETEKQRYEMVDMGDGNIAYIVKPAMRGAQPPHYLCANCYQQRKASALTHMHSRGMGDVLSCPSCKTKSLISRNYRAPT